MSLFKNVLAVGFVGVALLMGSVPDASAGAQETAAPASDDSLRSRIVASIKDSASLAAREVEVAVSEGVVTLKGTVRSAEEKTRAAELATVKGVTDVRNEIVVDANLAKRTAGKVIDATKKVGRKTGEVTKSAAVKTGEVTKSAAVKTGEVTKDAAVKTGEKTKEIAGKSGAKTKEVSAATGENITDAWITSKLKTKFIDEKALKDSDINVDTNGHVVTLKGTVASEAGKERAEAIANGTEGVASVVNELVVKAK